MKKQNRKNEDKEFVLGIITGRTKDNAVSMEKMQDITFFSKEKIKKIIHDLIVKDKLQIKVTDFPYGFYIEKRSDEEREEKIL